MITTLLVLSTAFAVEQGCGLSGEVHERIADCARHISGTCDGPFSEFFARHSSCSTAWVRLGKSTFVWRLVALTSDGKQIWRDEKTKLIWSDAFDRAVIATAAPKVCELAGGGSFSFAGQLRIPFRLPNHDDFQKADLHGISGVVPAIRRVSPLWRTTGGLAAFPAPGHRHKTSAPSDAKAKHSLVCVAYSNADPEPDNSSLVSDVERPGTQQSGKKGSTLIVE